MKVQRFLRGENLLASLLLTATATAQSTWNGGTSSSWSNAANWSPGIPASGGNIIIANTTANSLTLDGTTSRSVGSITYGATGTRTSAFTFSTGTNLLTINGGLTATGAFAAVGPTFNGNVVIGADQSWDIGGQIGTVTGDRGVFIRERSAGNLGTLAMNGDITKTGSGQLVIAATTISGSGDFIVNSGALKLNAGSSLLLTVGGTGKIQVNNSASLFISRNSGTMAITRDIEMTGTSTLVMGGGGTANTSTVASAINWAGTHTLELSNTGNLYVSSGNWTGAGTVNKTGSGTLTLNGSNAAFAGTLNITAGRVNLDTALGGNVTLSAAASIGGESTVGGNLTLNGGNLFINPISAGALGSTGNLVLSGTNPVNLTSPSSANTFTVLTYGGTLTGSAANFTLAGAAAYRSVSFDTSVGGIVTASVGASSRTWNGGANWDAGVSDNWVEGDLKFFNADAVTFGTTGAGTVAITGNLAPSSIAVNSNADYSFTAAAGNFISGTTGITKSGTGVMTLAGVNTYTGGVAVNDGTLRLANPQALGANGQSISVASGATLDLNGQLNAGRDYQITIAGTGVGGVGAILNNGAGSTNGFRSVTLSGDATVAGSGRWDIRPITAGTAVLDLAGFTLTKTGTNTVAMVDGTVSAAGDIEITQGTFAFTRSNVSGSGTVHANGGILLFENYSTGTFTKDIAVTDSTLRLQGSNFSLGSTLDATGTATLDVESGRTLTLANAIGGTGGISYIGAGSILLAADNSYLGTTTIGATGSFQVGTQGSTGTLGAGAVTNNGSLVINRSDTAYNVTNDIGGTGTLTIGQTNGGSFDSRVTLSGNNSFSGNVTILSGGLVATDSTSLGSGTKTVSINNGTTGRSQLYLDGSGGDITLAAGISFATSSTNLSHPAIGNIAGDNTIAGNISLTSGGGSTAIVVQGGSLALDGGISATTSGRSLILAGNSGAAGTVNGVISDGTNPLAVEKTGANTWTFTNANTYTGNTTVSGGTLALAAGGSIASSAQIIVGASTTLDVSATGGWTVGTTQTLTGTGTIVGDTTLAGDLRPGSSPGTLSFTGDLGLNAGSDLFIELGGTATPDYDRLLVSGNLDAGGNILVSFVNSFVAANGDSFQIASFGSFTGSGYTFDFSSAALDPELSWDTSQFGSTGTITVIPEPSHGLLLLIGFAGAACRRRRGALD